MTKKIINMHITDAFVIARIVNKYMFKDIYFLPCSMLYY